MVGFKLTGGLREGVTATDLVLTVTQMLRKKGVVEKFVEFYGPGLAADEPGRPRHHRQHGPRVRRHLRLLPGGRRDPALPAAHRPRRARWWTLVERYCKEQGLFRTDATPDPVFTDTLELDLATVEPSLAGPKRPQDRVPLSQMKDAFRKALTAPVKERGFGLAAEDLLAHARPSRCAARRASSRHGSVVIAAITSCTNTSNPSVMLGAGLLATKAVARGLTVPRLREDQPGPRLEGGDRVPARSRA